MSSSNTASTLSNCRIAMLATDGFEQSELLEPRRLLKEAGATVDLIAPNGASHIKGWDTSEWGEQVPVDVALKDAKVGDYDALVLPGGVMSPAKLRLESDAIARVKSFGVAGRPVAAICLGPWTLIDAGLVNGKKITSWLSLKNDLNNAAHTGKPVRWSRTVG
jgi:protease I